MAGLRGPRPPHETSTNAWKIGLDKGFKAPSNPAWAPGPAVLRLG